MNATWKQVAFFLFKLRKTVQKTTENRSKICGKPNAIFEI